MNKTLKVVLSYAHEDISMAKRIYQDLLRYGLEIWFDQVSILPDQNWEQEITQAIKDSDWLLVLLSSKSITYSGNAQNEVKNTLDVLDPDSTTGIKIITARLENCHPIDKRLQSHPWIDLFPVSKYQDGIKKIIKILELPKLIWRDEPTQLTENDVEKMIKKYGYYDFYKNPEAKDCSSNYQLLVLEGDPVVLDETTDLMWQQGGSDTWMEFEEATRWLEKLNQQSYAGYQDWRLPTLEEAMSLMLPVRNNDYLHLDPIFNKKQKWLWTADVLKDQDRAWVVDFSYGNCFHDAFHDYHSVRAVRSKPTSPG